MSHRPERILLIESNVDFEEQMVNTGLLRVSKVTQNNYDDEMMRKLDDLSNEWLTHTKKHQSQKSLTSTQQMIQSRPPIYENGSPRKNSNSKHLGKHAVRQNDRSPKMSQLEMYLEKGSVDDSCCCLLKSKRPTQTKVP